MLPDSHQSCKFTIYIEEKSIYIKYMQRRKLRKQSLEIPEILMKKLKFI